MSVGDEVKVVTKWIADVSTQNRQEACPANAQYSDSLQSFVLLEVQLLLWDHP